jgi:hypothetical protein
MKSTKNSAILGLAFGLALYLTTSSVAVSMGTAFTYQGRLIDANGLADGLYDFEFTLYDDANTFIGNKIGSDVNEPDVDVIDGYFTVVLDFNDPNAFNGDGRWLEIGVRPGESNEPNDFVTLIPRHEVTPSPYALYAKTAGSASGGGWVDDGAVVRLEDNGDSVGIGTAGPNGQLQVKGNGSVTDWITIDGSYGGFNSTIRSGEDLFIRAGDAGYTQVFKDSEFRTGTLNLGYNATASITTGNVNEDLTIAPNGTGDIILQGNVGIGMAGPGDKLDVAGHINSSESYKLDGATILSNAGTANILVGEGAGASVTIGVANAAMGSNALYSNTSGSWNSAMGYKALEKNTTGHSNSAMGYYALTSNTTGIQNTAMGRLALYSNSTGNYNSAVGYEALNSNNSGNDNSALGHGALKRNMSGSWNSAVGYMALYSNTTGGSNSALGREALFSNKTGFSNSAIGYGALRANASGNFNSAVGYKALNSNTGSWNSAMGYEALRSNTTGGANSALGFRALVSNTTGFYNSAVGYHAGYSNSTGSRNVFLGYRAGYNETGSNKLYIANDSADANVLIYGDFSTGKVGIGTTSPGAKLDVDMGTVSGVGGAATIGGSPNAATGDFAIATGYSTTAGGGSSTAMGMWSTASGYASTAIGYNTDANGSYSTAMGYDTKATELATTAMGLETIASGRYSTAMGYGIEARGQFSIAIALNN